MSKERACATTPALSRRAVLDTTPVAPAATETVAEFPTDGSEIVTLFHQHQAYREWINDRANGLSDNQIETHFDRLKMIEAQIMELPSKSAADFAAKVVVDFCEGSSLSSLEANGIWKEAKALLA